MYQPVKPGMYLSIHMHNRVYLLVYAHSAFLFHDAPIRQLSPADDKA